ncbi:hypothetical protein [Actinomadura sp. WMMB 499]|uniref:hypothetical protein n=1 Tax=Actinomadura sp. WMMB 499 TaxID=1219491 RepID=UPI0012483FC0|nr:hypothetical protein [Actinomadura sp. WMMB 499]QFG24909.1 hypothetical protein F7P10_31010 [Actinomadura sp. WMMB 499]
MRLYDHRTKRIEELPPGPLRIHLHGGGARALVTADLLRRLAERGRRRTRVTRAPSVEPDGCTFDDLRVPDFEVAGDASEGALLIGPTPVPGFSLVVFSDGRVPGDPLAVRFALLRARYRDPVLVDVARAHDDLARWRSRVAEWATAPGRPMDRGYAGEAADALADDLDGPRALAVMERLAADTGVPPGAKLETVVHLDLILGLDLVSAIGTA